MSDYTLNIFTNAHETAPSPLMVQKTYKSFCDTFGHVKPIIWVDPHPNVKHARKYIQNLRNQFSDVRETKSLSDGYVRSIRECETDYLFQLEGDWVFNREHITHGLDEILQQMSDRQIYHFRFNKRENKIAVWDKKMDAVDAPVPYCISNNLSNNPHIICRKVYRQYGLIEVIKILPGSKGIEECLNSYSDTHGDEDLYSAVYGPAGHPATITHLDGQGNRPSKKRPTIYKRSRLI